jgi:REP element-mobilizing transposase RayT
VPLIRPSEQLTSTRLGLWAGAGAVALSLCPKVCAGRGQRPLSTKEPLHVVFKVNRSVLRHKTLRTPMGRALIHNIVYKYGKKFFVKIEQISVQGDHCHLLLRAKRRSKFHDFFRVVAGQIAQRLQLEGLLNPKVTDAPRGSSRWPKSCGQQRHRLVEVPAVLPRGSGVAVL